MQPKITHIGLYTTNLEQMKQFYETYFHAISNEKYENADGFSSYFLTLGNEVRLEIMTHTRLEHRDIIDKMNGYCHIAISLGSREEVIAFTNRFAADGYEVVSKPRETGDGYFESKVLDPDGNLVELTI